MQSLRSCQFAMRMYDASTSTAEPADQFYAGKTITMSTYGAPGDSYDAYMRLLVRHYGRHIPGNPRFTVTNQPGAGVPGAGGAS